MLNLRSLTAAAMVVTLCGAAGADEKPGLNQVWSRLADVYGELGSVETAEFSPDSKYILTGTKFDYTVRVFRTVDGEQKWEVTLPQEIERAAWIGNDMVSSVSEDGLLRVFDAENGEVIFDYQHENGIDGLVTSNDGRWLVTGQERVDGIGPVRIFDVEADFELVETLEHVGTTNEVDFSSDDAMLAAVGDYEAIIWNTADWSVAHRWTLPEADDDPVYGDTQRLIFINCKFSPDDKYLAAGATNGFVYIYDTESGELVRRFNKSGQKTETVAWSLEGSFLLVAGHGYTIDAFRVDDLLDADIGNDALPYGFRTKVSDALEYMDFNALGTLFVTAHQDGTVQLWTYMSDDPTINARRHREVRQIQDEAAEQAGLQRN